MTLHHHYKHNGFRCLHCLHHLRSYCPTMPFRPLAPFRVFCQLPQCRSCHIDECLPTTGKEAMEELRRPQLISDDQRRLKWKRKNKFIEDVKINGKRVCVEYEILMDGIKTIEGTVIYKMWGMSFMLETFGHRDPKKEGKTVNYLSEWYEKQSIKYQQSDWHFVFVWQGKTINYSSICYPSRFIWFCVLRSVN